MTRMHNGTSAERREETGIYAAVLTRKGRIRLLAIAALAALAMFANGAFY